MVKKFIYKILFPEGEGWKKRCHLVEPYIRGLDILDIGSADPDNPSAEGKMHAWTKTVAKSSLGMDIRPPADVIANAEDFKLDKTFDSILAGELIEHLDNVGLFLDCAYKHLKPNGKLIITTPNAICPIYWFRTNPSCHEEHTQWHTRRTITQILERHGFKVVYISLYGHLSYTLFVVAERVEKNVQ